jgi:hypothetical protein
MPKINKIQRAIVNRKKNSVAKTGKKGQVATKKTPSHPSERMRRYAALLPIPGATRKQKAALAGYGPNTDTYGIEHTKAFMPLRERLEAAAAHERITPESNMAVLKSVMGDDKDRRSQVAAVKCSNEMMGWQAPQMLQVSHTHIIAEFITRIRDEGINLADVLKRIQSTRRLRATC